MEGSIIDSELKWYRLILVSIYIYISDFELIVVLIKIKV